MKILQVVPYFYPAWSYGGTPRVVYELSKELVTQGHELTIFTTDAYSRNRRLDPRKDLFDGYRNFPMFYRSKIDDIEVYYFKNLSNSLASGPKIFLTPTLPLFIKRSLGSFDIVHLQEFRTLQNVAAWYYCKRYGIPYVLSAHGAIKRIMGKEGQKKVFDRLFGYRILEDAEKIIALTDKEKEQYMEFGMEEKKIVIVPNGIDLGIFENLPEKGSFREKFSIKERYLVLYLGRIHLIKGVDFLVKGFALAVRRIPDVKLVIAGPDDGAKRFLEDLIEKLGLRQKILFTGILDGMEKLSAYVDADLFVHPSRFDNFPLAPLEAILCGCPVIVSEACGIADIIEVNGGFLVNSNDLEGLGEKIVDLLEGNNHGITDRLRKYIAENYNWPAVAKKIIEVYEEVVEDVRR